ncbi:hypothetical protein B0H12DRAFT_227796 [Mycena haematopus]|nr:hypothetical protein B0H12DRAFT_227796 [Mycena haematopus]
MFLQKISSITSGMNQSDKLIVFIAAHGEEDVMIGGEPLKISQVAGEVRNNATTILWATVCPSGKWLEGKSPWRGYVGAKEESDSLAALDSSYNRGGVSMLTTFATLATGQNAVVPLPYQTSSNSEKHRHYSDEPTLIREPIHCSHQTQANEAKKDLGNVYDAQTTADSQAQRPLPVPRLPTEVFNRFRLVRAVQQLARAAATPWNREWADSFLRVMEQLPPMPGLDLRELVASGTQLLDTRVSAAPLVPMSRWLQRATFEEADIRTLCSAYNHRRICQIAIESYIDWAGWKTTRPPRWDFSYGGSTEEGEMVVDDDDEETKNWRRFFCWRPTCTSSGYYYRTISWIDIRQQLALAWEAAGKLRFSAVEFLAVASHMDPMKVEGILI